MMDVEWLKDIHSVLIVFDACRKPPSPIMDFVWEEYQCIVARWESHVLDNPGEDSFWVATSLMYHLVSADAKPISIQNIGDPGANSRLRETVIDFAFLMGVELLGIDISAVRIAADKDKRVHKSMDTCREYLKDSYTGDPSQRDSTVTRFASELHTICRVV